MKLNGKRRKLEEETRNKEVKEKVKEQWERSKRLMKAKRKKEKLIRKIENRKIEIVKKGKSTEWIKRKQERWREYREKEGLNQKMKKNCGAE